MWIDCDDECLLINTEVHRQKFKPSSAIRGSPCASGSATTPTTTSRCAARSSRSSAASRRATTSTSSPMRYFGRAVRRRHDRERARHPAHPAAWHTDRTPWARAQGVRFGVGLWCLQSTTLTPRGHVRAYREFLDDVRLADELGYHSLWLSEHHFYYDGYCPALLTAAAAALAVSTRCTSAPGCCSPRTNGRSASPPPPPRSAALRRSPRRRARTRLPRRRVRRQGGAPPRTRAATRGARSTSSKRTLRPARSASGSAPTPPAGVARAGALGLGHPALRCTAAAASCAP